MSTIIQQWEEAGASLVIALTKYLDLSLLLEQNALLEGNSGKDLAMRIDSALFSLQTVVDSHVSQARSALARARNRILSPIYGLPREVLSGIFMNAVFGAPDLCKPEPMETSVARIYLTLHNILGVCKEWRDIALTQGSFWTIIPILDFPSRTREGKVKQTGAVVSRSIVRAKGPLHLVATQPCDSPYAKNLATLASQFSTANISTRNRSSLRRTLYMFLSQGSPERLALSQLSICQKQGSSYLCKLPKAKDYVFPYSSEQDAFQKISQNLSMLRIHGAQFHWSRFSFTNQLTELHLQEVLFGHELGQLFQAISSASELRILELISIVSFYNGPPTYTTPERSEIHLPNLQTLIVKDLYFNTLDHTLCSIASRSHRLTLLLNDKCRYADTVGVDSELVDVHWENLYELLRKVEVKDLLLSRDIDDPWLPSLQLGELLKSTISGLETLRLHSWQFGTVCSSVLAFHHLTKDPSCPGITDLHISCSKIFDHDTFMHMVLSHANSLRKMVLGGTLVRNTHDAPEPITLDNGPVVFDLIFCLRDFQLVEHDFIPPEFEQDVWQFW